MFTTLTRSQRLPLSIHRLCHSWLEAQPPCQTCCNNKLSVGKSWWLYTFHEFAMFTLTFFDNVTLLQPKLFPFANESPMDLWTSEMSPLNHLLRWRDGIDSKGKLVLDPTVRFTLVLMRRQAPEAESCYDLPVCRWLKPYV